MPKAAKRQRRPKGEGGLYQRSEDGLWVGSIELGYVNGVRKRATASGKRESAVRDKLRVKRKAFEALGAAPSAMTVGRWLDYWVEQIAAHRNRPQTVQAYRSIVRKHLIPILGKRRLDELQQQHVRDMIRALEKRDPPLSAAMVLKVWRVLGKALTDAMREGLVVRNVARLVDSPVRTAGEDRGHYTVDQARTLLRALAAHPDASRWAAALRLGPRPGEVLGLRIDRVDLERAEVIVDRQLQRLPYRHGCGDKAGKTWPCGHRFGGDCPKGALDVPRGFTYEQLEGGLCLTLPKSKAGERVVPLPRAMVELFRQQIARQATHPNPHGLMWTTDDGRPIDAKADRRAWVGLVASAGLPPLDLYAARHTVITLLINMGADVKVVGEAVGHTDPRTTRGYQHVTSSVSRAAIEALSDLLDEQV